MNEQIENSESNETANILVKSLMDLFKDPLTKLTRTKLSSLLTLSMATILLSSGMVALKDNEFDLGAGTMVIDKDVKWMIPLFFALVTAYFLVTFLISYMRESKLSKIGIGLAAANLESLVDDLVKQFETTPITDEAKEARIEEIRAELKIIPSKLGESVELDMELDAEYVRLHREMDLLRLETSELLNNFLEEGKMITNLDVYLKENVKKSAKLYFWIKAVDVIFPTIFGLVAIFFAIFVVL